MKYTEKFTKARTGKAVRDLSKMGMRGPHGGPRGGKGLYAGGPTGIKPGTIKRLLSYLDQYKLRMIFVFICIIISTAASVASSLFMQTLIDSYITPLLLEAAPVYTGLLRAICSGGACQPVLQQNHGCNFAKCPQGYQR